MTREGQEPNPDDTFAPPASTRWSEQDAPEDAGLVAPFIPGRTPPPGPAKRAPTGDAAADASRTVEPEPADSPESPDSAFPFDMPWADEPDPGAGAPGPDEAAGGASVADDDFPVEAFEIGDDWDRGVETGPAGGAEEPAGTGPAAEAEAGMGGAAAAAEVAERLEWLASRLREEGAEGVERELASSDRLTSLLAALLAGHLASR